MLLNWVTTETVLKWLDAISGNYVCFFFREKVALLSAVFLSGNSLLHHQLQHTRFPCPSPTPDLTQTNVHQVGDAIQPSHLLSSPSSPTFSLPQHQGFFQGVSFLQQVAEVLELQLQHQSFQWIFRTDFLRMNWLNLLAAQGTLKSLLQPHSSKASSLWNSAFFVVQLSYPCMTTGKTIALTRRTLVGIVLSLLFNMLSSLVIAFLPRSMCLLISWCSLPSTVILEPPKIKSATVSFFPHLFAVKWWGQMPWP